jgi:surface protein
MFFNCHSLVSVPEFDTSRVESMSYMFNNCYALTSIPLLTIDKVYSYDNLFSKCYSLSYIKLKNLDVHVDFSYCAVLSKESVLYMINNEAASGAITIRLESYAYERLATDADIVAALANHPNISISK